MTYHRNRTKKRGNGRGSIVYVRTWHPQARNASLHAEHPSFPLSSPPSITLHLDGNHRRRQELLVVPELHGKDAVRRTVRKG